MDTHIRPQGPAGTPTKPAPRGPGEPDSNNVHGADSQAARLTVLRSEENTAGESASARALAPPSETRTEGVGTSRTLSRPGSAEAGQGATPPTIVLLAEDEAVSSADTSGTTHPALLDVGLPDAQLASQEDQRGEDHGPGLAATAVQDRPMSAAPSAPASRALSGTSPRWAERKDHGHTEEGTRGPSTSSQKSNDDLADDRAPHAPEASNDGGFHIPPARQLDFVSVRNHWTSLSTAAEPSAINTGDGTARQPIEPSGEIRATGRIGSDAGGRQSRWWSQALTQDGSDLAAADGLEIGVLRSSASDASEISVQQTRPGRWRGRLTAWFRPDRRTGVPQQRCEHVWQPGWDGADRPIMRCIRCRELDVEPPTVPASTTPPTPSFQTEPGPLWRPADEGRAFSALLDHAALKHRTYRRPRIR